MQLSFDRKRRAGEGAERRSRNESPSFRAKRSAVEESLVPVGSGGAEQGARSSSAPPLPAKVRDSSTALRSVRNDRKGARFLTAVAALLCCAAASASAADGAKVTFDDHVLPI